ncbi:MAG: Plug domain-containing protein, partial [Verrucomicrobiota bacterium]
MTGIHRYASRLVLGGCLLGAGLSRSAEVPSTNAPTVLPEITVVGHTLRGSLVSPTLEQAEGQKEQVPGGFTVRGTAEMDRGRASNFQDLLQGVPGVTLQSENGMEVSKVSIRGSGILSEDEPLGVEFLLDGFPFNQGDG